MRRCFRAGPRIYQKVAAKPMKNAKKRSAKFEKPIHGQKPIFQGSLTTLKNGGKHSYELMKYLSFIPTIPKIFLNASKPKTALWAPNNFVSSTGNTLIREQT